MAIVSDADESTGNCAAKGAAREPMNNRTAMWIFVVGDLFVFGAYFVIYLVKRILHHDMFAASEAALDPTIGAVNTLVLLTSSLFVALCVHSARAKNYAKAILYAALTVLAGVCFAASKIYEWSFEIREGHTLASNEFFTFYYFLTGMHVFHLLCGLIVLGVVIRELSDVKLRASDVIEAGATYWHMVDLLWVVIFALLYLIK